MKNKLIVLGTALAVLVCALCFTLADRATGPVRYLQHLEEPVPTPCGDHGAETLCSHLPLMILDTGGTEIPGVPLSHEKDAPVSTAADGSPMVAVSFSTVDTAGVSHHPDDAPSLTGTALIRIRGNSSRHFDKKSYLLKLTNSAGDDDRSAPVMGISSASEWVLNGPFLDRTLVRNYLCYSVAGQVMDYAPNVRFCELILNGEYRGVYLMAEAITKGGGRVELTEPERGKALTSWLVRFDRDGKGDTPLDTFTHYSFQSGVSGLDLRYPGRNTVTPERIAYVEAEISQIERIIYSADFQNPTTGYAAYLDAEAFAQYFILNEFFGNVDAGRFSTYYYKDMRGKVKPVVWDFNNACDNYISYVYDESGFNMTQSPWFGQLLRDEAFVRRVIAQYRALRRGVLSDDSITALIDGAVDYLGDAVDRNYEVWGYVLEVAAPDEENYLYPLSRNYQSHGEAVEQLKGWLAARGAWLDEHIDTLLQYCQDSKNATQILD